MHTLLILQLLSEYNMAKREVLVFLAVIVGAIALLGITFSLGLSASLLILLAVFVIAIALL